MALTYYFRTPFGAAGDRTPIEEDSQPSGIVNYTDGYGTTYELDPDTQATARRVERRQFNENFYNATVSLKEYQERGVPDFIESSQNQGNPFPYSQYARVRYDPGGGFRLYESLINNNTTLPTNAANWRIIDAGNVGTASQFDVGIGFNELAVVGNPNSNPLATDQVILSTQNANGYFLLWSSNRRTQFGRISGFCNDGFLGTVTLPASYLVPSDYDIQTSFESAPSFTTAGGSFHIECPTLSRTQNDFQVFVYGPTGFFVDVFWHVDTTQVA